MLRPWWMAEGSSERMTQRRVTRRTLLSGLAAMHLLMLHSGRLSSPPSGNQLCQRGRRWTVRGRGSRIVVWNGGSVEWPLGRPTTLRRSRLGAVLPWLDGARELDSLLVGYGNFLGGRGPLAGGRPSFVAHRSIPECTLA